jgi:hypothetical protein
MIDEVNNTEAYIKVYEILNRYYDENVDEGYEDLSNMLADMNPFIWKAPKDGEIISVDPAVYDDWKEEWIKVVGEGNDGNAVQIFDVAKSILEYYETNLEYDLNGAKEYLKATLAAMF